MASVKKPVPAKQCASIFPLTVAHLVGLGALQVGVALALFDPLLGVIPLLLFVIACFIAPFIPRLQFFGPVITGGDRREPAVALTFDDGPTPSMIPQLLELLARHRVKATFFVVGQRAVANAEMTKQILAAGHDIGNHSWSHDPLLMLRSRRKLAQEVAACQVALRRFNVRPYCFRPPVGIVNPRLWRVLLQQGMITVGFRRRALDFGNRQVQGMARRLLKKVRPGDIVLLHDGPLAPSITEEQWLREVELVILGIKLQGLKLLPLARLIKRPVMEWLGTPHQDAVSVFYDGLAWQYDEEQERAATAPARRTERELVSQSLETLLRPEHEVLEVGAGTGRFTLEMAPLVKRVNAVDISRGMLIHLKHKAAEADIHNITIRAGDIQELELENQFDVICAFSAVEYIRDLPALLEKLSALLKPGGTLLITTAHRSLFRFFTQIGNALRQGIWLHARSVRGMRRVLKRAGLVPEDLSTHVLKNPLNSGMLLLVKAKAPEERRTPGP